MLCHHTQLIFVFLVKTGFCLVDQGGLEPLTSGDPWTSASQSAEIRVMSHTVPGLSNFHFNGITVAVMRTECVYKEGRGRWVRRQLQ